MKVLVLSNGEFENKAIKNELEDLQAIVGGYIEIPYLSKAFSKNEIDIIINEEGKFIDGLKPEIAVVDKETNVVLDIVYGNCIFASHDEEGNTIELTEAQKEIVKYELRMDVVLTYNTGKQVLVKALFI
jgi:hypothetical protein